MSPLKLESVVPWSPHPRARPLTGRLAESTLGIAANGSRTCVGGWQCTYAGVVGSETYRFDVQGHYEHLAHPRDNLECTAHWAPIGADDLRDSSAWDYLLLSTAMADGPTPGDASRAFGFARALTAPIGATHLTVRYTFRWSATGATEWQLPSITVEQAPARRAVRICVVTGNATSRAGEWTLARNIEFYTGLCRQACRASPDLILLPEVCLQWQVKGSALDLAVPVPGPETDAFAQVTRQNRVRIVLGTFERDGDAVYNTAALISPDGTIDGRYHKVHLAVLGESDSGVLPGDEFPVFDTEIGRIGCNICMDSSAAESSRMIGLNGADFLVLPIMGDHRSDRWTVGNPIFNESRWKAIMRTRALDNQLTMVVARNTAQGSCVINRKGDILAWNEGDQDFVSAEVRLEDGYRTWNGGCFRSVNWVQRRPHVYGEFTNEDNWGGLGAPRQAEGRRGS